MSKTEHRVSVEGGKYTFIVPADDYRVSILRHGEPWHGPQSEASNALHQIMMELDAARVVVQAVRAARERLVEPRAPQIPPSIIDALASHDSLVDDREPPSAWCGEEAQGASAERSSAGWPRRSPPKRGCPCDDGDGEGCPEHGIGSPDQDPFVQRVVQARVAKLDREMAESPAVADTPAPERCPRCRFTPCRKMFQCSEEGGYRFVDPPPDLDDLERRATRDAQRLDALHGDPSRAGGWIGHRDYAQALVLLIPRLRVAEAALRTNDERLAQARDRIRELEDTP